MILTFGFVFSSKNADIHLAGLNNLSGKFGQGTRARTRMTLKRTSLTFLLICSSGGTSFSVSDFRLFPYWTKIYDGHYFNVNTRFSCKSTCFFRRLFIILIKFRSFSGERNERGCEIYDTLSKSFFAIYFCFLNLFYNYIWSSRLD